VQGWARSRTGARTKAARWGIQHEGAASFAADGPAMLHVTQNPELL